MLSELLEQLEQYLNHRIDLVQLEEWLVSHLQTILDSGNEQAIKIANEIDADLIEFKENLVDQATVYNRFRGYFASSITFSGTMGTPLFEPQIVKSGTSSVIINRFMEVTPVDEYHLDLQLA